MENTGNRRIVIAGGSGFLGLNLAGHLHEHGFEPVLLSRHAPTASCVWRHIEWDGQTLGPWAEALEGAYGIVNLAGRSVDCIKTAEHCDEILRSRVEATAALGKACRSLNEPPSRWVQMSTAHIYGDPPVRICDEASAFGYGLAPTVGRSWEAAFAEAALPEMRTVVLRTSFVLGRSGGALPRLSRLARLGLGGTVGHGKQGVSWIHEHDMNRIFTAALTEADMHGVYLATSETPVSNMEFMSELRRALRMPIGLPAAAWMVNLAAPWVMRTDPELALCGRYCVPSRLVAEGFKFRFARLSDALDDLLDRAPMAVAS